MSIEAAQAVGAEQAKRVLKFRQARLAARDAAVAASRQTGPASTTAGYLIAEGDSWFDYPFYDVLNNLEDLHGFDVESVATKGDTIEDMAYNGGQLEKFVRRLEKMIRRNEIPTAILLSGGGNDIAGDELKFLLNHATSPTPGLNQKIVDGLFNERLQDAYVTIIHSVTKVSEAMLNTRIPIIVHGYAYAIPDGRGYLGGWGPLPGPWLEPGLNEKGYEDLTANSKLLRDLIDKFNEMLQLLTQVRDFSHVHYLNLRPWLNSDINGDYKDDWGNELHPTEDGFEKVAEKFAELINQL